MLNLKKIIKIIFNIQYLIIIIFLLRRQYKIILPIKVLTGLKKNSNTHIKLYFFCVLGLLYLRFIILFCIKEVIINENGKKSLGGIVDVK